MQAAHQLRLQQLLESGRLTPAPSPTPEQPAAAAASPAKSRNNKKRGQSKLKLEAVAEANPPYLPESMSYIVCISSRSPDVALENDHNLHWLAFRHTELREHHANEPS